MAHMRERFGFGPGQFPVAEDASDAARWRCRSSPSSARSQIDRVCEALAEALRGDWT